MKIDRTVIAVAGAVFLLALANPLLADTARLFVTVTGSSVQDRAMPLVLANQAMDQGSEVRVLLCGDGAMLSLSDYQAERFAPRDITPTDLLQRLMANGSTVEVCAIFLPNSEHDADQLRDGITVANPADVAAWMMAPNTRILSH